MQKLISRYLVWMECMEYAAGTRWHRRKYLEEFAIWCDQRGLTRVREVSPLVLESYRRHVFRLSTKDGKPLQTASQSQRLQAVKQWFRWLYKEKRVSYNPAADLDMPRMEKRLPSNVLTVSEMEAVINQTDINENLGLRDRAILEMFYTTGLRCSELMNLKMKDIELEQGTVYVRLGKGKKDRVVPMGERAMKWLERYLEEVRPVLVAKRRVGEDKEGNLSKIFLSKTGRPFTDNSTFSKIVSRYVNQAELGKSGACHLLRHTMATQMLENGADIRYIQEILGHERLSSTQIYTRVSIHHLKEVHRRTHPSAMLERRQKTYLDEL